MPRRETRYDIERALAEQHRRLRALRPDLPRAVLAEVANEMARQRKRIALDEFVEIHVRNERGSPKVVVKRGRRRRRPGDGSMPALVEPPRGPRPLAGGAAAPLEFD